MLITSNRSVAEWGTVFADPVVATAILDRLLHHSHVLTIRGDSYRLRAKRKSGLIKPPAGDGQSYAMRAVPAELVNGPSSRPEPRHPEWRRSRSTCATQPKSSRRSRISHAPAMAA